MRKNKLGFFASLLTASVLLAACGGGEGTGTNTDSGNANKDSSQASETSSTEKVSTKDTISWMNLLHTPAPPSGDVEAKLEEYTGMNIDYQWIPDAAKEERLSTALASDTLADIVQLTILNNTNVRQALTAGMFWDVEPYLSEFDNLASINENTLEAARIDGKIYGVPIQKPIARYGVLVRQDWLDNLGLEVPHTLEELREVTRAFTEDDPDGNGIADTVGIVDRNASYAVGFRSLTGYFGAADQFHVEEDGTVIPSFMQPEYKEAMEWYRDIYANGWMNSDFAVMPKNEQKDYLVNGKAGIIVSGLFEANNFRIAAVGTPEEEVMEWALVNDMTYGDVPRRIATDTSGGMGGLMAIPKSNVKTEEDLRVVLQFINDLMDIEPYTWMTHGIEGVHFELDDEERVIVMDDTKWQQEVQAFSSARPSEVTHILKLESELSNEANEKMAENVDYVITNPVQSLESETYTTHWTSLVEGIEDAYYQYIMGEIEMADFDKAIETFLNNGGQSVIDEYTAAYAEAN